MCIGVQSWPQEGGEIQQLQPWLLTDKHGLIEFVLEGCVAKWLRLGTAAWSSQASIHSPAWCDLTQPRSYLTRKIVGNGHCLTQE